MTREEIEKAINNGESVWVVLEESACNINTNKTLYKIINVSEQYLYLYANVTTKYYPLKQVYKTKAEAEHYLNHANITRTEELPFLTWEEFLKKKKFHFIDKFGNWYDLLISDDMLLLRQEDTFNNFRGDATEENFYKAYDECVRLFKGEE